MRAPNEGGGWRLVLSSGWSASLAFNSFVNNSHLERERTKRSAKKKIIKINKKKEKGTPQ
jgi:hypothetical protein